ncbi:hypothetical protein [Altererythrobacter sp. MTPC7]|uniref:hypothetical protein n=1 Tax=Altererythrobacter sp. MTPC7 TaxID=3056567 RepID=UPI0036F40102
MKRYLRTPLPDRELELWRSLPPEKRDSVNNRLEALARWEDKTSDIEDVADLAGLSTSRFYSLSALWSDPEQRSLANLGIHADGPRRRRSRYDAELLQRMAAESVRAVARAPKKGFSIEKCITGVLDAVADTPHDIPGRATVRLMVEDAIRERSRGSVVGNDIAFDCCAIDVPGEDARPFVLFVGLDKSTGLLLGFAVAALNESVTGYREAAEDVVGRLRTRTGTEVPWAETLTSVELVIGNDLDAFREWEGKVRSEVRPVNFQGFNPHRRFGRYIMGSVGRMIGRIGLLPAATLERRAISGVQPKDWHTLDEARERMEIEMIVHNRHIAQSWQARFTDPNCMPPLPDRLAHTVGVMIDR